MENGVLFNLKTNTRIAPSSKVPQPFKVHKNNNIDSSWEKTFGISKRYRDLNNLKILFKLKNAIKSGGYAYEQLQLAALLKADQITLLAKYFYCTLKLRWSRMFKLFCIINH